MGHTPAIDLRKIIKDEEKLMPSHLPPSLPHRGKELNALRVAFSSLKENPDSSGPVVLIKGKIGVGKTVVSRFFVKSFAKELSDKFQPAYVNCKRKGSPNLVLREIIRTIYPEFPSRGLSLSEWLSTLEDALMASKKRVFIILDELQELRGNEKEGEELIYGIFRMHEGSPIKPPPVILIVREWFPPYLLKPILWSFITLKMTFEPYSKEQLFDILKYRARLALREGSYDEEVLEQIAELASKPNRGSARYAIGLLHQAALLAEMDGNDRILPEHVRIAGSFDRPMEERECTDEEIRDLPLHEKILLLAVSRTLIKSQDVLVRMGKVEEEYRVICEEYGVPPYGHTAVWRRIRSLGERGFIELRKSGKGYRGQTTLIGMNAFPAKSLEERVRQLIESAIVGEDMDV
ncbi:MAG: hypothetical protein DRO00_05185 [Thermoproteota archaeon]|nr:MAG: hypothetical protein DRN92_01170 [Candidatus Korarchaeota archaeon]RLG49703.1 MAG: hypothetical protein DRN90_01110 [Candidatus Korarchaeota archaeon]RLG52713.1 MAG: hypothetical protein DRO00_05185 [Candidatus Korarchaeota archaeon]